MFKELPAAFAQMHSSDGKYTSRENLKYRREQQQHNKNIYHQE